MNEWSQQLLWDKARLFMQRALSEAREGPLFPFWAALSLELLARAALAKVHPALLADPREPDNVLAVFGYRTSDRPPTSIPAKALFKRCSVVVPDFTTDDATFCTRIASLRNEELHAGTAAFADYPTGQWLGEFYRVSNVLLGFLDEDLYSFLGDDGEAGAAEELVAATQARVEKTVKDEISSLARTWDALDEQTQEERRRRRIQPRPAHAKEVECPACQSRALLTGDVASVSEPRAVEDGIERDVVIQPTQLACPACGLNLTGVPSLYAASRDLAGQFTEVTFESPEDFYGIEIPDFPDYEYEYENE